MLKKLQIQLAKWCTPIVLALGRLRHDDLKFKSSLGYIVRSCLKNKQQQTPQGWWSGSSPSMTA
jgi:hypothetical protein